MEEDEGFQGVSVEKSSKITKYYPIVINNTLSMLGSVISLKTGIKIPSIIVHQRVELYVNRMRSVHRHNDFNRNFNSKYSQINVKTLNDQQKILADLAAEKVDNYNFAGKDQLVKKFVVKAALGLKPEDLIKEIKGKIKK